DDLGELHAFPTRRSSDLAFPEAEGGAGFDHVAYSIVIEEISRCCASTGVILSVQNSLYCDPIHRYGTEEQKKQFLVPYARGEKRSEEHTSELQSRGHLVC